MNSVVYQNHLQNTLLPALAAQREAIAVVNQDIVDYQQVSTRLKAITSDVSRTTATELGAGVYVTAKVPSTATVTLDLGLDIHMSLPRAEAAEYAAKRADVLGKRVKAMESREERLRWEVEQFQGAIKEAEAREALTTAAGDAP